MSNKTEQGLSQLSGAITPVDAADGDDLVPAPQTRSRRRVVFTIGAVVVILTLLVTVIGIRRSPTKQQPTYIFAMVTNGTLATTVTATGPLESNIVGASFSVDGTLTEIDVQVGQTVKAGQLLAKLNATALQDALSQAQAQVGIAQANVNSAQVAIDNAKLGVTGAQTTLDNANSNLNDVRNQTQAQLAVAYDNEQTAIDTCNNPPDGTTALPNCIQSAQDTYNAAQVSVQGQVSSAQGSVSNAQIALQAAQGQVTSATTQQQPVQSAYQAATQSEQAALRNLHSSLLFAPQAGIVLAINGAVGSAPGTSATDPGSGFIEIANLSQMQALVNVNEADVSGLAIGQTANFTVSAYKNRILTGTIAAIDPAGTATQNVVTFPVSINVNMARAQGIQLYPGMTANVTVTTTVRPNSLLLPASALTFARAASPTGTLKLLSRAQMAQAMNSATDLLRTQLQAHPDLAKDNPQAAYVIRDQAGVLQAIPVVLGLSNGQNTVVVTGLQVGETVVTGKVGTTTASTTPAFPFGGGRGGFGGGQGFGGG